MLEHTTIGFSDKDEVFIMLVLFSACLMLFAIYQFKRLLWKLCPVVDAKITGVNLVEVGGMDKYIVDFSYEWKGQYYDGQIKEKITAIVPKCAKYEVGNHYLIVRNPITKKCRPKEEIDYESNVAMSFLLTLVYAVSLTVTTIRLYLWLPEHMISENEAWIPKETMDKIGPTVIFIGFGTMGILVIGQAIIGIIKDGMQVLEFKNNKYTPIDAILKGYNMVIKRTRRGSSVKYSPYYEYELMGEKYLIASKRGRSKLNMSKIGSRTQIYRHIVKDNFIDRCPDQKEFIDHGSYLMLGVFIMVSTMYIMGNF